MAQKNEPAKPSVNVSVDPKFTPILYADFVYIKSNENGIVLDFAQQLGPSDQFNIVSRIGMSKEHARRMIEHLEGLLRSEGTTSTQKN